MADVDNSKVRDVLAIALVIFLVWYLFKKMHRTSGAATVRIPGAASSSGGGGCCCGGSSAGAQIVAEGENQEGAISPGNGPLSSASSGLQYGSGAGAYQRGSTFPNS